jgi:DNA-binding FrmR family transcriptional regulator
MAEERGCCGSAQRPREDGVLATAVPRRSSGKAPEAEMGTREMFEREVGAPEVVEREVGAPEVVERSPAERTRLLARLRRAEGQVAAIRRMVEEDAYCVDVLVQIAAVRGALGRVGEEVLQHHVETCVTEAFRADDRTARQVKIDELMEVFARYGGFGRGQ